MTVANAIELLKTYTGPLGLTLHSAASEELIEKVEQAYGINLPEDFKIFYRFTDGFETVEDLFNMIPLLEIIENRTQHNNKSIYIAEYMIYCDMWQLEINPEDCNAYQIIINHNNNNLILTHSLAEFIDRFLKGGVFEPGGLYQWQEEMERQPIYTTKIKTTTHLLTLFYFGLRYNLISKKEVIDWADRLIMHEDEPESFFIDLSLSHDKNDLISLLNTTQLQEDSVSARAMLGLLYQRLKDDSILVSDALEILDKHQFSKLLTHNEMKFIYNFTNELWMNDHISNDAQLKQNLLNFLTGYKDFEISNYKNWFGFNIRIQYEHSEKKANTNQSHSFAPKADTKRQTNVTLYILAVISVFVLIMFNPTTTNNQQSNTFVCYTYQLSKFYLSTFVFCYTIKSGVWLGKITTALLKKMFRMSR